MPSRRRPFPVLSLALLAFVPLAALPAQQGRAGAAKEPKRVDTIERHGITWRLAEARATGTYANGDPWVLGPVRVVAIEPQCTMEGGRMVNGSMVDPVAGKVEQGYDSRLFTQPRATDNGYFHSKNKAVDLSDRKPLELQPGQSLVSVASRLEGDDPPRIRTAAVLTVVAEPPPADAFRPPYVKGAEKKTYRVADLNWSVLRDVKPVVGTPPIEKVAAGFERVWLDHLPTWAVRYLHPKESMPDYGRDLATVVGSAALQLNLALPVEKKRLLAIRFVQLGIDNYAALRGGCRWEGNGGHGSGRKLPILVAGALLRDADMLDIGHQYVTVCRGKEGGETRFGEDCQTFFVQETSPGVFNWGFGEYTKEHVGLPEWGFCHAVDPSKDHVSWEKDSYRTCCTANAWVGQLLAARLMGLQSAWHHEPLFAYMDRYMEKRQKEGWHRAWADWHAAMWDAYRRQY